MKTFELKGELRNELGKTASKKYRKAGKMPCVLYGGEDNVNFVVETVDLKKLVYTPKVYIVDLSVDGKNRKAVLKDLQFHAVSDDIAHLDFYEIFDNKPVEMSIPVELTGVAPGVRAGGKLQLVNRKLKVKALPGNLPDTLDVDISELNLGKSIKVADVSFENLQVLNAKNTVIASVKLTRASKGTAGTEATEEKKA